MVWIVHEIFENPSHSWIFIFFGTKINISSIFKNLLKYPHIYDFGIYNFYRRLIYLKGRAREISICWPSPRRIQWLLGLGQGQSQQSGTPTWSPTWVMGAQLHTYPTGRFTGVHPLLHKSTRDGPPSFSCSWVLLIGSCLPSHQNAKQRYSKSLWKV